MYSKYSCLDLPAVKSQEDLNTLIVSYASSIYEEFQETDALPDDLDDITDEISAASGTDAIEQIATFLRTYIKDIDFSDAGCSLLVEACADFDEAPSELVEPFITFLFSRSGTTHFLMRTMGFDREGAFAQQWLGYWLDGEVVTENTDAYFKKLFSQESAPWLQRA